MRLQRSSCRLPRKQARDIACDHVELEIDHVTGPQRVERRLRARDRDDADAETAAFDFVYGQRDAIERDRALGRDRQLAAAWNLEGQTERLTVRPPRDQFALRVDVTEHDVAAELVTEAQRTFEIEPRANTPRAGGRPRAGFGRNLHREPIAALFEHRKADAGAGNRRAERQV